MSRTETILSETLLELTEKKTLSKITIKELLETSGVSRHSFYNSFQDIYELIEYTFVNRIVDSSWDSLASSFNDYYYGILLSAKKMNKYRKFCLEAWEMEGQNAPREAIIRHSHDSEVYDLKRIFSKPEDVPAIHFLADFYSNGAVNVLFNWLSSLEPVTPEEIARRITEARFALISLYVDDEKEAERIKKFGNSVFLGKNSQ